MNTGHIEQLIDHQADLQTQVNSLNLQVSAIAGVAIGLAVLLAVVIWRQRP